MRGSQALSLHHCFSVIAGFALQVPSPPPEPDTHHHLTHPASYRDLQRDLQSLGAREEQVFPPPVGQLCLQPLQREVKMHQGEARSMSPSGFKIFNSIFFGAKAVLCPSHWQPCGTPMKLCSDNSGGDFPSALCLLDTPKELLRKQISSFLLKYATQTLPPHHSFTFL